MALDVVCKHDRDGVIDEQKKSIVKQAMRITSLKQKIDTAEVAIRCLERQLSKMYDHIAVMKETIQLKDQTIEALQGKLQARDRELIEKRDRITDLEAKLESNERLIDLKDKLVERMMDMLRGR